MNPFISVIVPVYNAQAYIAGCIESILKQTYPHVELLLIIDGATDDSASICHRMQAEDPRITVVDKANEGVSATRNLGIQMAKGEYVCFIDSDDKVAENYLETLLNAAETNAAQLVLCHYQYERETGMFPSGEPELPSYCADTNDLFECYIRPIFRIDRAPNIMGSACRSIISRALLVDNGILFPPCRICEDQLFLLSVLTVCHKVAAINEALYFYNDMVGTSAIRCPYKKDILSDQINYLNGLRDRVERLPITREEKNITYAYGLLSVRKLLLTNAAMNPDDVKRKEEISQIRRSVVFGEHIPADVYRRWFLSQPPKTCAAELLLKLRMYTLLRKLRS